MTGPPKNIPSKHQTLRGMTGCLGKLKVGIFNHPKLETIILVGLTSKG